MPNFFSRSTRAFSSPDISFLNISFCSSSVKSGFVFEEHAGTEESRMRKKPQVRILRIDVIEAAPVNNCVSGGVGFLPHRRNAYQISSYDSAHSRSSSPTPTRFV